MKSPILLIKFPYYEKKDFYQEKVCFQETEVLNLYFWMILFICIVVLANGVLRNGMVKELEGLVAGVFSVAALILISGLARGSIGEQVSSKALAIALLIVLGGVYSICRLAFSALKLFAGLPVIHAADAVLGLAAGGAKAFLLLYVVDHILRIWLNL